MGLSEELEALRQHGSVKSKSTLLSESVTKHGFTSPETEASKLKQKSLQEKQSRLDAQVALSRGASGMAQSELNLLYKKLIDEQRKKKREAELNLREWRKQHVGKDKDGKGTDGKLIEGEEPPMQPTDTEEDNINMEALEMLPQHVVAALKIKYETNNAAEALSKALKEESEHDSNGEEGGGGGGGMLAKLMEVTATTGGTPVKGEMPYDEASEHSSPGKIDKEDYVVVSNDGSTSATVEEDKTEAKGEDEKEAKTTATADEPVEEVREKVEQLTLEDQTPPQDKVEDSTATPTKSSKSTKPDLSHIPNSQRIEQTKRFYNVHSQEYIDKLTSQSESTVLTPIQHRETFMTHVQSQQSLNETDKITLIDLGCGFGRDTKHFIDLGHYVLGVDYSYEMLNHAKSLVPKAHYLNMDIRQLKNVLVDQSLDGVWANASLLHLPKCDVLDVLKGMFIALKVGGVLFVSFKIRNDNENDDDGGEVFEADERYTKSEIASPASVKGEEEDAQVEDDTRRKLYSYYTEVEVRELLENANFDVMEMGTNDLRESSEYAKHAWIYAFATRRKE